MFHSPAKEVEKGVEVCRVWAWDIWTWPETISLDLFSRGYQQGTAEDEKNRSAAPEVLGLGEFSMCQNPRKNLWFSGDSKVGHVGDGCLYPPLKNGIIVPIFMVFVRASTTFMEVHHHADFILHRGFMIIFITLTTSLRIFTWYHLYHPYGFGIMLGPWWDHGDLFGRPRWFSCCSLLFGRGRLRTASGWERE